MEPVELFQAIEEGEFDPTISDANVKFYYETPTYGVIPRVRPAKQHYKEQQKNFVYPRSLNPRDWTHLDEPGVTEAMQTGWVVPIPHELKVQSVTSESIEPETWVNGYINNYHAHMGCSTSESVFHMDTACIVELPEGYSLLAVSPCNYTDSRFTVIPQVMDADEFPQRLRIPVRIHSDNFRIDAGTPLVQVFPFKRTDYGIDATVGTFRPGERDSIESECTNKSAE